MNPSPKGPPPLPPYPDPKTTAEGSAGAALGDGASERPVPSKPVDRHDPVWISLRSLGEGIVAINKRLDVVEPKAEEACVRSMEALTKVDAVAAAQVNAQQSFTAALERNTKAFIDVGESVKSARTVGVAMLVGLVAMTFVTIATLIVSVSR